MDALVNSEIREEGGDTSVKVEGLTKAAILKGLSPRVMLSSHLLPKGTKRKDRAGQHTESKNEQMQPPLSVPTPVAETLHAQTAVSSVPKPKVDLGKMHFKKQILSVSVIEESPITSVVLQDPPPSEQQVLMKSSGEIETVTSTRPSQSQNSVQNMGSECPSENALTHVSDVKPDLSLKELTDSSHVGKVDVNGSSVTEQQDASENIPIRSRSDGTLPGSESDADSVQTSSSHNNSGEPKATAKSESRKTVSSQDGVGQSEDSDSDDSESDSDCGAAVKRMQSVVVVPKNSTLTHSDTTDKPVSPCTPSTSPGRQQHANGASGQEGDLDRKEITSRVSPQQRHRGFPTMCESTRQASNACVDGSLSLHDSMVYQSQSNMVDSTSQLEGSNATDAQPYKDPYSSAHERPKIGAATVSQVAAHSLETSFRQSETGHPQHYESGRGGGMLSRYQHGDFASSDDFNSSLGSLGWDFTQPEQPSSSLAFVQAHEISSNCRGSVNATPESIAIVEPPRDKDNSRPHRGRGPPKKRRPEMESDSDSEAEPGLASKRERLAERELPKVSSKDSRETPGQAEVQRPLLSLRDFRDASNWREMARSKKMPPYFDLIEENLYLTERKKNKSHRDIKRMQCECFYALEGGAVSWNDGLWGGLP
ncbi:hypothetical protein J4Q44_G00027550 [Coregonus suidteri]|uniref:Uncharacterized protein n=1 Tax=Coregonus suidteri TaxID=861788 RepID=A0AAN8R4U7_9TELE